MSDTVKLIIEIPKDYYEVMQRNKVIFGSSRSGETLTSVIYSAVVNGTLLDDVKAEIQTRHDSIQKNIQYDNGRIDALEWVLDVLDNVGSEVKPDEVKNKKRTESLP